MRHVTAHLDETDFDPILVNMTGETETLYFDATLTPNRSLSPRAFLLVMGIVIAMSFFAGLSFVAMGAFPVIGFFGLDALAIWLAFRWSFRAGKQETRVRMTSDQIDLVHFRPGQAPRQARLPTAFARISLDFPARRPSELKLAHGDKAWVIGRFLTPSERQSLKRALDEALRRARNERYASET